jgi:precorrin-8X/cobalt-precorrin-8 methylmutase
MTHPIEAESYRRLAARVDLSRLPPGQRAVVARVIHATADVGFADSLCFSDGAVDAGILAIQSGAPVVVDVEMVRAGIGGASECFLAEARAAGAGVESRPAGAGAESRAAGAGAESRAAGAVGHPTTTLSARAMRLAAQHHPDGAVYVVGCAPTALEQLLDLVKAGLVRPALVVGVPVGFVGAAEAKEWLRTFADLASISNVGERGGSAVAAAIVNALSRPSDPSNAGGRIDTEGY